MNARFLVTSTNAPISSVSYSIYIDGSIAGTGQVFSIEDGGNQLVTFTFIAEEGNHDFKVVLNPNSQLEETNMNNNEIQVSFTVEGSSNSNLPIYIVVFAVILVGGAVLYSYSKRETKLITKTKAAPVIQESSVNFPLILNCTKCGSRVRVARPGSFRCPSCKAVSLVDSNGKIENTGQEKEIIDKPLPESIIDSAESQKPISPTNRRRRMEDFLLDEKKEEENEEPEVELSASEKLKLLKEEEEEQEQEQEHVSNQSKEIQDVETEDSQIDEAEPEKVQEKPTKKRKGPPKGGSFGPTVGGF